MVYTTAQSVCFFVCLEKNLATKSLFEIWCQQIIDGLQPDESGRFCNDLSFTVILLVVINSPQLMIL